MDVHSSELIITQTGFRGDTHYSDTVKLWKDTIGFMKLTADKMYLKRRITATFNQLFSCIKELSDIRYNQDKSPKWTMGQIVEHIVLGNADFKNFLTGSKAESQDPYDMHCAEIRVLMSNRKVPMQAPEFLIPQNNEYDKEKHLRALTDMQDELISCIDTLDLTQKSTTFELPPFGFLSFFEWLTFAAFHIERHRLQIAEYAENTV